ncbi:hypothetical protein Pst134EA_011571 [Puccinia striiformis f. sp. tritici]|uniref:hypothetical protein n=1 Tax=Puccinia striiformis f. sp. tritici TaxID=168172 RepID=UPI0020081BCF|nr:hypothetical protein Pst134EA_011571 [Puccinia striiformis f. sp. tritici]KAH9467951.1 hypothetical protein Pst134EA_011571 [Puccinia striiformis f. sp. tritici]
MELSFVHLYANLFISYSVLLLLANLFQPGEAVQTKLDGYRTSDLNDYFDEDEAKDENLILLESPASTKLSSPEFASPAGQVSSAFSATIQGSIPLGVLHVDSQKNANDLTSPRGEKKCGWDGSATGIVMKPFPKAGGLTVAKKQKYQRVSHALDRGVRASLETNRESDGFFSVLDWDFVRQDPETQTTADSVVSKELQPEVVFRILKSWVRFDQKYEGPFFIPRASVESFFHRYRTQNGLFFAEEIQSGYRRAALFSTISHISNNKIDFNSLPIYSKGIIKKINSDLVRRAEASSHSIRKESIKRLIKIVEETTQTASFLIVIYLSLFGKHKQGMLTRDVLEEILSVLAKLWKDIMKFTPKIIQRYDWSKDLLKMLNTGKTYQSLRLNRKEFNFEGFQLDIAWDFVEYWTRISLSSTALLADWNDDLKFGQNLCVQLISHAIIVRFSFVYEIFPIHYDLPKLPFLTFYSSSSVIASDLDIRPDLGSASLEKRF